MYVNWNNRYTKVVIVMLITVCLAMTVLLIVALRTQRAPVQIVGSGDSDTALEIKDLSTRVDALERKLETPVIELKDK